MGIRRLKRDVEDRGNGWRVEDGGEVDGRKTLTVLREKMVTGQWKTRENERRSRNECYCSIEDCWTVVDGEVDDTGKIVGNNVR